MDPQKCETLIIITTCRLQRGALAWEEENIKLFNPVNLPGRGEPLADFF